MASDSAGHSASERVAALRDAHPADAAREVLNATVGSRTAKRAYVDAGAAAGLVCALRASLPRPESATIVSALGSLSCNFDQGAIAAVEAGAPEVLADALFAADMSIVQAVARTLKILLQTDVTRQALCNALLTRDIPLENSESQSSGTESSQSDDSSSSAFTRHREPRTPGRIVALMSDPDANLSEICARIIENLCTNEYAAEVFERAGAASALMQLLRLSEHEPTQKGVLSALTALCKCKPALSSWLANDGISSLAAPHICSSSSEMRIIAARLLAHTCHVESTAFDAVPVRYNAMSGLVLELVNLLRPEAPKNVRLDAASVLKGLVLKSEKLQRVACEAGAVPFLAELLGVQVQQIPTSNRASSLRRLGILGSTRTASLWPPREMNLDSNALGLVDNRVTRDGEPRPLSPSSAAQILSADIGTLEVVFDCLASLCSLWDPSRDACVRANILQMVFVVLDHANPRVVVGGLRCIRSLTRSLKIIRHEMDPTNAMGRLLRLLKSDCLEIQKQAIACICNMVVNFASRLSASVSDDDVDLIVSLVHSSDLDTRIYVLRSLKNITCGADANTTSLVVNRLTRDHLLELLEDDSTAIREQALGLVRNLTQPRLLLDADQNVSLMHESAAEKLMHVLLQCLRERASHALQEQALYVLCNVASASEDSKAWIIKSTIMRHVLECTEDKNAEIRVAAVWCITNLCWKESSFGERDVPISRHMSGFANVNGVLRRYCRRELLQNPLESVHVVSSSNCVTASAQDNRTPRSSPSAERNSLNTEASSQGQAGENPQHNRNVSMQDVAHSTFIYRMDNSGWAWRIRRMRELGFERRLESMQEDKDADIAERARVALDLFGEPGYLTPPQHPEDDIVVIGELDTCGGLY